MRTTYSLFGVKNACQNMKEQNHITLMKKSASSLTLEHMPPNSSGNAITIFQ